MESDRDLDVETDFARRTAVENSELLRQHSFGGLAAGVLAIAAYLGVAWNERDHDLLVLWAICAVLAMLLMFVSLLNAKPDQSLDSYQLPIATRLTHTIGGLVWGSVFLVAAAGPTGSEIPFVELCVMFAMSAGVMGGAGFRRLGLDILRVSWLTCSMVAFAQGELVIAVATGSFILILTRDTRLHEFQLSELRELRYVSQLDALAANRQAEIDPLTGLVNRLGLKRMAALLVEDGIDAVAAIFVDLDHFKVVNDTYGHQAGDHVLKVVASRLTTVIGASDIVGRQGGDEFFLLLGDTVTDEQVGAVATTLLRRIEEPIPVGDTEIVVSASVGTTVLDIDGFDLDRAFAETDRAMYCAKTAGRGLVVRHVETADQPDVLTPTSIGRVDTVTPKQS